MSEQENVTHGWGFPGRSRKAHYFTASGRSLCAKWGFYNGPTEDDNHNSPDNCATCKRRLEKLRPQEPAPMTDSTERLEKAVKEWLDLYSVEDQYRELAAHLTAAGLVWRDDNMDDFLHAVATEVERAEVKWPDNNVLHRLAALSGEVGELAQGYLKDESVEALTIEAIQVAAMAYRIIRALAQPTDGEPTP